MVLRDINGLYAIAGVTHATEFPASTKNKMGHALTLEKITDRYVLYRLGAAFAA